MINTGIPNQYLCLRTVIVDKNYIRKNEHWFYQKYIVSWIKTSLWFFFIWSLHKSIMSTGEHSEFSDWLVILMKFGRHVNSWLRIVYFLTIFIVTQTSMWIVYWLSMIKYYIMFGDDAGLSALLLLENHIWSLILSTL